MPCVSVYGPTQTTDTLHTSTTKVRSRMYQMYQNALDTGDRSSVQFIQGGEPVDRPVGRTTYREEVREVEVPSDSYLPPMSQVWTGISTGSWAILLFILLVWGKYGGKIEQFFQGYNRLIESVQKNQEINAEKSNKIIEALIKMETRLDSIFSNILQNADAGIFRRKERRTEVIEENRHVDTDKEGNEREG